MPEMIAGLKNKELIEHQHSKRSFVSFTSIIQMVPSENEKAIIGIHILAQCGLKNLVADSY